MNRKIIYCTLLLLSAAFAGCKDDKEQDYLDYLASLEKPSEPSNLDDPDSSDPLSFLAINELNGNAKYIELYNGGEETLDISGIILRKDDSKIIYEAPVETKISAKGFLVLHGNATDFTEGFTSGLSADKATIIQLLDPNGKELDVFKNLPENPGDAWNTPGTYSCKPGQGSFSRFPDGTGKWYVGESTEGYANVKGNIQINW